MKFLPRLLVVCRGVILVRRFMHGGRWVAAPQLCWAMLAMAYAILAIGCHRTEDATPGVVVKESIAPQPPRIGPAIVSIKVSDPLQKPVSHATIMVEADMSHPGMSPIFAEAKEITPGSYRAPIDFSMGGDWVVLLHIKLPDGRRIERQTDVRGVLSN